MFAMYTPWETLDNLWLTLHNVPLHVFHDVCSTTGNVLAPLFFHKTPTMLMICKIKVIITAQRSCTNLIFLITLIT